MGWCSGSEVAFDVLRSTKDMKDQEERFKVVLEIFKSLEHMDWDCQSDVEQDEMGRRVLRHLHPDWDWSFWDEDVDLTVATDEFLSYDLHYALGSSPLNKGDGHNWIFNKRDRDKFIDELTTKFRFSLDLFLPS